MATNANVCGVCDLRHISKPSTDWCPVCEEALCADCKEHHTLLKATRGHNTITITDYQKLPANVSEIKQCCSNHEERFQLFCRAHDCPICTKCTKTHAECTVIPLDDVIANTKTSEAFQDLIQNIADLAQNLNMMKKDRELNIANIADQRTKCENEIRTIRQKVNEHLDKLQEQVMKELSISEDKIIRKIQTSLTCINDKQSEIKECQSVLQNVKLYASDLQTFLGMKNIQAKVANYDDFIQHLVDNKDLDLDHTHISLSINFVLRDISSVIATFGSVDLKTTTSDVTVFRQKDRQAQILSEKPRPINDIKLKFLQNVFEADSSRSIRGCCIAPSGDFLFICHYKGDSISVSTDGSIKFTLSTKPNYAFDTVFVDDKTAVYTSGRSDEQKLTIIDLTTRKALKLISFQGKPYGITLNDQFFIVSVKGIGIQLLNRTTYQISTIVSCKLDDYSYVAEHSGNIYFTSPGTSAVTCCDMTGQTKWEFKNESCLKQPSGIVVDSRGNVYVGGRWSENVVVISPDGKEYKELLTKDDGLTDPTGLCVDRIRNRLLVANCKGASYLFDIV